jgi:ectoine hydroxylase-related dioxygenase (phytanoyl-CoA dioxygenase family)
MRFVSSLIDKQVDGVLIVTTSLEDVFVEELMHHQIPFVALDWPGPEGFELTPDKTSFYPKGGEPKGYVGFDIPGLVPLFTEPGDEIIFADRTYHSAFPNQSDQVRLSCAIGFRARSAHIDAPWPRSPLAQHFVDALPAHLQPLVENYVGIDPQWRRAAMVG